MIQRNASDRRLGYAHGILALGDALIDDLRERGVIGDSDATQCHGCQLIEAGFVFTGQRWDFAAEIIHQDSDSG